MHDGPHSPTLEDLPEASVPATLLKPELTPRVPRESVQRGGRTASFLKQGQRLENLSWRLWHLQNLIVDTDNARSKCEFRKLSKVMGDKLDKEKGR